MKESAPELQACPYCGSFKIRPGAEYVDGKTYAQCDECGATGPTSSLATFRQEWNKRGEPVIPMMPESVYSEEDQEHLAMGEFTVGPETIVAPKDEAKKNE